MAEHSMPENTKNAAAPVSDVTTEKMKLNNLAGDLVILMIMTFASAVFMEEGYLPDGAAAVLRGTMFTVCALSWVFISFYNGVMGRFVYAVFPAVFWLLPQLIIYLADSGPEFMRMSVVMYALSEFSSLITLNNGEFFGNILHVSPFAGAVLLMLISYIGFGIGAKLFFDDKKKQM